MTEIANQLSLSIKTVSTYRSRILEKMRLKSNPTSSSTSRSTTSPREEATPFTSWTDKAIGRIPPHGIHHDRHGVNRRSPS